ncbi:DNA topoisomerase [Vibrio crassostreae]|uniref:DNA topoisomerase n=1 Tax=Vibrio crassostreae TaxID=246167 RepID=UPI001B30AE61|nr:DNA topoisomerase [Vibrio crassostreae]
MKYGLIAEKPELGLDIANTLSSDYKHNGDHIICNDISMVITWCVGSMLDLMDPEDFNPEDKQWSLDRLPMQWPIGYKPGEGKSKLLNSIKRNLLNVNIIINACDTDNSGEAIFWLVYQHLGFKQQVKRMLIVDNNLIGAAWNNLQDGLDFYQNAQAEIARSIADQVFGYNITRCLTKQANLQGYDGVLTSGRVQTVILALVVRRMRSINNFKPVDYYNVTIDLNLGQVTLKNCRYVPTELDPTDEENRLNDLQFSEHLTEQLIGQVATLVEFSNTDKRKQAPLPFDLGSLQIEASKLYNFSPDKVMKLTQSLRAKKAITYNRTDSRYLSEEAHDMAESLLNILSYIEDLEPVIAHTDPSKKSRAFNSKKVTAHHGIIPTQNISGLSECSDDEYSIYLLIARNYVIQFLPPKIIQEAKFTVDVHGRKFKKTLTAVKQAGWSALFQNDATDEDLRNEEDSELSDVLDLSQVNEGNTYPINNSSSKPQKTSPLPLYTIATLLTDLTNTAKYVTDEEVKAMLLAKDADNDDRGGIGTAATRTPIVTDLFKKKFMVLKSKKIYPEQIGEVIIDALPEVITTPEQTALWANQQMLIEEQKLSVDDFLSGIHAFVSDQVFAIKQGISIPKELIHESKTAPCPSCGGSASSKSGKHSEYFQCSDCSETFQSYKGNLFVGLSTNCPKCNGLANQKVGTSGLYWTCSDKESCGANFNDKDNTLLVPEEKQCPKCMNNNVVKRGRNWFCESLCGWIDDWKGEPTFGKCPQCSSDLRNFLPSKGKRKGIVSRGCSDWNGCGYKVS